MSARRPAAPLDPGSYTVGAEAMRAAVVAALRERVEEAQAKVDARAGAPRPDRIEVLTAAVELGTAACALRDAEAVRLPGVPRRRRGLA